MASIHRTITTKRRGQTKGGFSPQSGGAEGVGPVPGRDTQRGAEIRTISARSKALQTRADNLQCRAVLIKENPMTRNLAPVTALAVATTLLGSSLSWAGSAGRKNTAIAATALAVGAWSNHTGRAGRKNTAILATAGAAVAWGRYSSKKRQEN